MIKLTKTDKQDLLAFAVMGVIAMLFINFLVKDQNAFKDCKVNALKAGFPDYTYIVDTKQCYGKNKIKAELLYYSIDNK